MKRSFRGASIGVAITFALGTFAVLNPGCGAVDANGFFAWETCDILNCDGLFFRNLADDHDDMAGVGGMNDADAHDDEDDDHMDGVDDHDDDGDDDHMEDMDEHNDDDDDAEETQRVTPDGTRRARTGGGDKCDRNMTTDSGPS